MTKIPKSDPQPIRDTTNARDRFAKVVRAPASCHGAGFYPLPRVTVDNLGDSECLGPQGLVAAGKLRERRRIYRVT